MTKRLKIWSGLGLAAIGSASLANAAGVGVFAPPPAANGYILVQDAGGEGGGEGGGSAPGSYIMGSTDENAFKYDAAAQISSYADLVNTSYSAALIAADQLEKSIDALLATPNDTTLAATRAAWVAARPAYLKTETFRFYDGPIEDVEGSINAWPMNEAFIDYVDGKANAGIINDPTIVLSAETIGGKNQVSDEADVTVGWHAIEFLLWGQDLSTTAPGNRPVADFISGQGNNDRRRTYLKLVTSKLVQDLSGLEQAWSSTNKGNYRDTFLALPQREALGRMINGMAILAGFEFMSERLSVALDSGDQEDEHSCFSDTTKQDFIYDLVGIKQVWTGDNDATNRAGLDELVRSQNAALADKVDALLADTETKIAALGDPWDQVLASSKGSPERVAAEAVIVALQSLATGLTAVGNQLGVLVLVPAG